LPGALTAFAKVLFAAALSGIVRAFTRAAVS
jgi:hypothetical protein